MTHQEKRIYALSRRALIENAGKVLLTAGAAGGFAGITGKLHAEETRNSKSSIPSGTASIAALPAIDAILLYAAEADRLFKSEGLDVKIVPFMSALEMTAALRAKRIAGQYTNLMTTITQQANGIDASIAATTWHTDPRRRAFGFAVSPKHVSEVPTLDALRGKAGISTAASSGTITDWMLDNFIANAGIPEQTLKQVEIPQISIRLQLLNSGKLETALFYEPLLTLIELKGGKVIWDDRELNEPLSMISLRSEYLTEDFVLPLRRALAEAARRVDDAPGLYLKLAQRKRLIPENIVEGYVLQKFGGFPTPDGLPELLGRDVVKRASDWLIRRGILSKAPDLERIVCRC